MRYTIEIYYLGCLDNWLCLVGRHSQMSWVTLFLPPSQQISRQCSINGKNVVRPGRTVCTPSRLLPRGIERHNRMHCSWRKTRFLALRKARSWRLARSFLAKSNINCRASRETPGGEREESLTMKTRSSGTGEPRRLGNVVLLTLMPCFFIALSLIRGRFAPIG
jgi:hypothetical protein